MVQFNNRTTGEQVDLEANEPQAEVEHHGAILKHIAEMTRIARTKKETPSTVFDQLATARESAFSSMKSHKEGNLVAAQANMHGAAAYTRIAAESLGIPVGATPEVEQSMTLANKASDVSDDYQRKTGGTHFSVGRFQ